ncbi:MAG: hypothetical protein ACI8W3_003078 [Myxococcota bacterium]|jgi:hypothetical protein
MASKIEMITTRDEATTQKKPVTGRRHKSAALGITVALITWSGTAQAEADFESGFEYEMGRMVANHFAAITQLALFGYEPQTIVVREVRPRHARHKRHYKANHRWGNRYDNMRSRRDKRHHHRGYTRNNRNRNGDVAYTNGHDNRRGRQS